MNLHRTPIAVTDAVQAVMQHKKEGRKERLPLSECFGRILGEDLIATHPVPPFHKSPYDGFAFRSQDTKELSRDQPGHFIVTETVPAGHRAEQSIDQGQAVRIMTGAEIPDGADCVAMFEICQTYEEGNRSYVTLKRPLQPNQNVIEKGSETKEEEVLVEAGTYINPGVQALLATFGYANPLVFSKPKIGVFATGTELLDVEEKLQPGKIRNSNAYMILSQVERSGGNGVYLGKLDDDFETCYQAVSNALDHVDALLTTGGVSVGDYDLMPDIYQKLEAEVLFNKVAMRPGSVTTVAKVKDKLLFGLSGNPSACYVGFELFAFPIIQSFVGRNQLYHPRIQATLGKDFKKPNPFTRFVRGFISYERGNVYVYPTGMDKSAVVSSLANTNVLIMLRGGTRGYEKGDTVEAIMLDAQQRQVEF